MRNSCARSSSDPSTPECPAFIDNRYIKLNSVKFSITYVALSRCKKSKCVESMSPRTIVSESDCSRRVRPTLISLLSPFPLTYSSKMASFFRTGKKIVAIGRSVLLPFPAGGCVGGLP